MMFFEYSSSIMSKYILISIDI